MGYVWRTSAAALRPSSTSCSGVYLFFGSLIGVCALTLATTVVALALIATGTFQRLVAVVAFFLAGNYVVCCLALIVLRRREPDRPRTFHAWGYPWSAGLVLVGAAAFLIGAAIGDSVNAAGAIALLALGLAIRPLTARGQQRVAVDG